VESVKYLYLYLQMSDEAGVVIASDKHSSLFDSVFF
jgi:hypothetical protein